MSEGEAQVLRQRATDTKNCGNETRETGFRTPMVRVVCEHIFLRLFSRFGWLVEVLSFGLFPGPEFNSYFVAGISNWGNTPY
jgi:hypothetical protein